MCGAGISGGATLGTRARGAIGAPVLWPGACPLLCSQCQIFSNIPEKSYLNSRAFGELLFSGYFIARIIFENNRKYYFALFNLNNRK